MAKRTRAAAVHRPINVHRPTVPDWRVGMSLSMRERLIVRMVADGYTDREIAEMLARSPHTIREHVKHVYAKLGVQRRTVLVRWALESRSRIPGLTAA